MNYKKARGYLSPDEREYLFTMAKESNLILNIGVEYGASIHCFRDGNPNATIIAIDLIGNEKFEGDVGKQVYFDDTQVTIHNSDFSIIDSLKQPFVLFIKADSNTLEIDRTSALIFIDGCHWGECVKNDIDKYSQLATKYLLFHDYSDSPIHLGVKEALDNWDCTGFQKIKQVDTIAVYKRVEHK